MIPTFWNVVSAISGEQWSIYLTTCRKNIQLLVDSNEEDSKNVIEINSKI